MSIKPGSLTWSGDGPAVHFVVAVRQLQGEAPMMLTVEGGRPDVSWMLQFQYHHRWSGKKHWRSWPY